MLLNLHQSSAKPQSGITGLKLNADLRRFNWENILKLSLLQDLTKVKPSDPDIFHLLGEVKYEFKGLSCFILVR
nr:hypothetical protein CFP56_36787 [Quercus suber]